MGTPLLVALTLILALVQTLLLTKAAVAQPPVEWVKAPQLAFDRDGRSGWVTFELNRFTDVEVAIVDPATAVVVRHLAAGVLGDNPPPPLAAKSLAQKITWDGKDDFGEPCAAPTKLVARVRAGMSVKLDRIVGGDPYAFWSEWSGQGDHAQWMVTGLEAKSDGQVFVLGNTTFYGAPSLRQYDARGKYRRTVFPPPAGKPVDEVRGWGVNVRADGRYVLQSRTGWGQATPGKTLLSRGGQAVCASLVPSPSQDTLCLTSVGGRDFANQQTIVGRDGTLAEYQAGIMLGGEPLPPKGLSGNLFSALSPDGKSMYVSGLFATDDKNDVATTGFWRDGQVWKVDLSTRKTQVFFALGEKDVIRSIKARSATPIGHTNANPYAAFQGVATDAEGHVFVCDRQNQRIVVLSTEGRFIRAISVAYPDAIAANPKSRALYVTTRFGDYGGKGELKLLKIDDWTNDDAAAISVSLRSGIGKFRENSLVTVVEGGADGNGGLKTTSANAVLASDKAVAPFSVIPASPLTPTPLPVACCVDGSGVAAGLLTQHPMGRGAARSATFLSAQGNDERANEAKQAADTKRASEFYVWVAYTTLPVRVYRDAGASLELVQDFYEAGPQRALDLQHMEVDQKTGDVFIADAQGFCFRVTDWTDPKFELCRQDAMTPLRASGIAIDARRRRLYTHYQWGTPVYRWAMDGEYFKPVVTGNSMENVTGASTDGQPKESDFTIPGRPVPSVGFAHAITPPIACSWIFTGLGERGFAVDPAGGLATLGVLPDKDNRADDYSGPLHYFAPDSARTPWRPVRFRGFGGKQPRSGGVRFDLQGNLYVGLYDGVVNNVPQGFEADPDFRATTGRIYKYAPTGTVANGNLFPAEPAAPAKVYDVHYGPLGPQSRTPRFGVDGYGRIYYPTGQSPQVSLIDNAGNSILAFGTYGNRDSLGGMPGDQAPTKDVPLSWPNSVDATDDYIYVSDITNVRLLRLEKQFKLSTSSRP